MFHLAEFDLAVSDEVGNGVLLFYPAELSPILALMLGWRNSTNGLLRIEEGRAYNSVKFVIESKGLGGEIYFTAVDVGFSASTCRADIDINHCDGGLQRAILPLRNSDANT